MIHPVIIGVADIKNKERRCRNDGSDEPLALILQAIDGAIKDSGADIQSRIDSISVVRPWSWPYPDLPSLLAEKLKVNPTYKTITPHGGNQPAKLLDEACRRISKGETKVAVITGGEALDSLSEYIKAQTVPPPGWTETEDFEAFAADALKPPSGETLEGIHGIGAPIQVYALYENSLRAQKGQSFQENHNESARMYAEFAEVSSKNPVSWHYGKADSKETIGTVSPKNRMICTPYTMLMCAFNKVNIAGACIVTSDVIAKEMGVDESKWIYVKGGAGTAESEEFYLRTDYSSSPAISQSIDAALKVSEANKDDIDLYDFYSCFPVVPKLACKHLGLATSNPKQPITLLGGLTSFGGAGNNYSMHAITEMTRQLREGKGTNGLILANGGVLSYQHVVVLSSNPRQSAYPSSPPLPEYCDKLPSSDFERTAEGDAIIETYTVDYTRKGKPRRGHVIGRLLKNNHRFVANNADEHTLTILADTSGKEVVGRKGRVIVSEEDAGRNLFSLVSDVKL
jgi:acetyl-CoA acetyltransferase